MDQMTITSEGDLVRERVRINPDVSSVVLQDMKVLRPNTDLNAVYDDKPLKPVVRVFCDFPPTYPADKKFGLQFTCLRQEESNHKIVVSMDDQFGEDVRGHEIPHQSMLAHNDLPYFVQRQNSIGHTGVRGNDVITVFLTPEEFTRLLSDLASQHEVTIDVTRQMEESLAIRQVESQRWKEEMLKAERRNNLLKGNNISSYGNPELLDSDKNNLLDSDKNNLGDYNPYSSIDSIGDNKGFNK